MRKWLPDLSGRKEAAWLRTRVKEIQQELEAMEKENERHKLMFANMKTKHDQMKRKLKDILEDA